MKRYIKTAKEIPLKLINLEKAIEKSKHTDLDLFDNCDFRYRVEDDGVEGSVSVWLADYSENIGASEFYEYKFVSELIESFSKAVRMDTGDIDFYFEPYDAVDFCGRAWFKLTNNEHIFPNSIR